MAKPNYWLLKSEPDVYSFERLTQEKRANWNDIRNYQARNFLRASKVGDLALIYHTGDERQVVGIAKVIKEAYPDPDEDGGDWSQIDIAPIKKLKTPVTLAEIKKNPVFKDFLLIKQTRLSVVAVSESHFSTILKLGGVSL